MAYEIRLVQEIEKHECLYNNYQPGNNRRDLADEAWILVSQNTGLAVAECKEKWRNIRNSLLRSLKPSEKTKKPYYLAIYLNFVLPFLRPISILEYTGEIQNPSTLRNRLGASDILICDVKSEDVTETVVGTTNTEITYEQSYLDPLLAQPTTSVYKKKRNDVTSNHKSEKTLLKQYKLIDDQSFDPLLDTPRCNSDSMRYFLMSLLPEFEAMTEEQSRMFKIKVMMIIDDIIMNYDNVKQNMPSPNESNRLQKRLINLLLEKLKKK